MDCMEYFSTSIGLKRHVLLFDKLISAIPPRREVVQKRPIFLTLERATLAVCLMPTFDRACPGQPNKGYVEKR